VIINATKAMLSGVPWQLLKFGSTCCNQPLAIQGMMAHYLFFLTTWSGGPPLDLVMSKFDELVAILGCDFHGGGGFVRDLCFLVQEA
jgi:hypothetical protein